MCGAAVHGLIQTIPSLLSYEESYAGQLRKLVGNRMLLTPGVRGLIRDEHGRVLFGS